MPHETYEMLLAVEGSVRDEFRSEDVALDRRRNGDPQEPEARAHHRVLLELLAHRNAIRNDPTGRQAAAWLSGKRAQGVSASVKAITELGLYSRLSHCSHGGPEPVLHLLDSNRQTLPLARATPLQLAPLFCFTPALRAHRQ